VRIQDVYQWGRKIWTRNDMKKIHLNKIDNQISQVFKILEGVMPYPHQPSKSANDNMFAFFLLLNTCMYHGYVNSWIWKWFNTRLLYWCIAGFPTGSEHFLTELSPSSVPAELCPNIRLMHTCIVSTTSSK
jgi:hypothetical protein